jgi:tetratricopeptide (TPR) repeat protein
MKGMKFVLGTLFMLILGNAWAQGETNYYALASAEMNNKNYVKAEEYYMAALALEPTNWNIMSKLGFCLSKQKRFKDADSLFRVCVKNDTTSSTIYGYKGWNHVALKQDSMVVVCFKKFIFIERNKDVNKIIAFRNVGQAYQRMLKTQGLYSWQIDDMIFHLEQIERIDPSNLEVEDIKNFIEVLKIKRPASQVGKWIMP